MGNFQDKKYIQTLLFAKETISSLQANNTVICALENIRNTKFIFLNIDYIFHAGSAVQQERQDDLTNTLLSLRQVLKLHKCSI